MDFVRFIFSSFWIWVGFTIILYLVLSFGIDGIVQLVNAFRRNPTKILDNENNKTDTDQTK